MMKFTKKAKLTPKFKVGDIVVGNDNLKIFGLTLGMEGRVLRAREDRHEFDDGRGTYVDRGMKIAYRVETVDGIRYWVWEDEVRAQ